MNITINPMTKHDIERIFEISSLSFNVSWSKEAYTNELQNPLAKYFVAKIQNKTVGFLGSLLILDEADITNIAVDPEYRNQGIASFLLNSFIKYCENLGFISFTLEVRESNFAARSLYLKHGFKEEGLRKGYYKDNKENAVLMGLRKNPSD